MIGLASLAAQYEHLAGRLHRSWRAAWRALEETEGAEARYEARRQTVVLYRMWKEARETAAELRRYYDGQITQTRLPDYDRWVFPPTDG